MADEYTIDTLLTAANADLDSGGSMSSHSQRFMGLTIIASIEYSNFSPLRGPREASYIYKVSDVYCLVACV